MSDGLRDQNGLSDHQSPRDQGKPTGEGRRPGRKAAFYPESRFGGFSEVDGTIAFYSRVRALLHPGSVVVDYGCGRGAYGDDRVPYRRDLRILKGKVARVIGLDVDPAGAANPYIDEFCRLEGGGRSGGWPVESSSVDLCISDHVLEHLEEPEAFFSEANRVLKPSGTLCIRTPNRWSYVALLSRLVPNRTHAQVLEKVKAGIQAVDVFPTLYRCNSLAGLRKELAKHGFEHVVYGFGPEPSYLEFSHLAYALGVLYQRYAPRALQPVIFAFGLKSAHEREAGTYGTS